MRLFILLALAFVVPKALFADGNNPITGNMNPTPGSVETYTVTWENWNSQMEQLADVYWEVSNGQILSFDRHTVTIEWNQTTWMEENGHITVYETLTGWSGYTAVLLLRDIEGITEDCSGILGQPLVFENFGSGSNPGPPFAGCTYVYRPFCAVSSGEYTRLNSTVACRGLWRELTEDHTPGDVNGYMLLIDGDDQRGEVFSRRVTVANGLTSAFRYEFSAYIANLYDGRNIDRPRLRFEIYNDAGIKIAESGNFRISYDDIDPWKRISMMVDVPFGSTFLDIVLINRNDDPDGNDFVVDDLSFAPCLPPILASLSNTSILSKAYTCNSGSVTLFASWPSTRPIPFANPQYRWQRSIDDGFTWTDIANATTINWVQVEPTGGIYKYRVYAYDASNPSFTIFSNVLTFLVQKMVVTPETFDIYSCNPAPVQLSPRWHLQYSDVPGSVYYTNTYSWSPGTYLSSTNQPSPTITLPALTPPAYTASSAPPPITYTYTFSVQNTTYPACNASAVQTVRHFNPRKVVVPTAFTPNNDGANDLFRPLNIQDYSGGKFWVYDRWGNLVFYSQGPTLLDFSWNGKHSNGQDADPGNYTWRVEIPGCPNNIFNGAGGNQINNPFGNVLLIR